MTRISPLAEKCFSASGEPAKNGRAANQSRLSDGFSVKLSVPAPAGQQYRG
ncbi:MAG: hypothetical protein Q8J78_07495 [Moraxellaceae bacterium]|nr:hypothetical protein [Moraxellaceae bacterium]